jgi:integrase
MKLFKDGLLIPEQRAQTFGEFSKGWWDTETCRYLKWRQLHEPIVQSTIIGHRNNFENHIKDYFAKYRLDEITSHTVEGWLLHLSEKNQMAKGKTEKKLKAVTINGALGTFKLMIKEAVRMNLLKTNPCNDVKELKEEVAKREILTLDEVSKLFPADWSAIWNDKMIYTAHRLAACTGLRIGELRGLRGEYVFDDHIFITGQYTYFGYVANTKTKHNRNVPISSLMRQELDELLEVNGDGFVFSEDSGETPVKVDRLRRALDRALERIGISYEDKLRRNLSFHAWRHFFNTFLRMSNVADSKVQSVTGHRSAKMTDHYTHFDTRQFTEVRNVQAELLALPDNSLAKPEREKTAQTTDKKKSAA